jgi:UDP-N-acetylglucosamine--N-acetylmuramyl-(pentapeptide) pyrophosphoryl-undecaprenol N-acetylglucosamine transferase
MTEIPDKRHQPSPLVYLAPCGIALGHAGRCIPIAKKLVAEGFDVVFSTYGDAVGFVEREGFRTLQVPTIKMGEREDGSFDFNLTTLQGPQQIQNLKDQVRAEYTQMKVLRPSLVVSDSRLSPIIAAKTLGIPCLLLLHQLKVLIPHRTRLGIGRRLLKIVAERVMLEGLGAVWSRSDLIFVPDFPPPLTIAKSNMHKRFLRNRKIRFVGPVIPILPSELPSKSEIRRKLKIDPSRRLIYASIGGTVDEKLEITRLLERTLEKLSDEYAFIISRGLPDVNMPERREDNFLVVNWIPNRFEVLKAADLIIGRGGHNTVAEAIYYGVPQIHIPSPFHSEHESNARSAVELGVAKVLQQDLLSGEAVREAVTEALSQDFRRRVERIQAKASSFNAVQSVVEAAETFVQSQLK